MSRPVRPLLYMDDGGIPPGSLFSAASTDGAVGRWTPAPRIGLLDPTKSYTMDEMIGAYNDLLWLFHQARIVQSEPLLLFNSVGTGSVNFVRTKADGTEYTVTYTPGVGAVTLGGIMPELQGLFPNDSGIKIIRQNDAITILLLDGALRFEDAPSNTLTGTAQRIMNILFAGAFDRGISRSISQQTAFKMNETYEPRGTPIILQGNPHTGPYTKGDDIAPVSGLRSISKTDSSISLDWTVHPAVGITYYLELISENGEVVRHETSNTSITISNLRQFTKYNITIMAGTSRGLSKNSDPIEVITDNKIVVIPNPGLSIDPTTITDTSLVVKWNIPDDLEVITTIVITLVKPGLDLSVNEYNASLGSITITDLYPDSPYTVNAYFKSINQLPGNGEAISIRTLPEPGPTIREVKKYNTSVDVILMKAPPTTVSSIDIEITNRDSITVYQFSPNSDTYSLSLYPNTDYGIRVRYKNNNDEYTSYSNTVNFKTLTTMFGPTKTLENSTSERGDLNITLNSINDFVGFRVETTSEFIGYKFNRIQFPIIPSYGEGIISVISNPGNDKIPSKLKISVYNKSKQATDAQLIAISPITDIQYSLSFGYSYNFTLYDPITFQEKSILIKPDIHIVFESLDNIQIILRGSTIQQFPLTGIAGNTLTYVPNTGITYMCLFDYIPTVPSYPFGSISDIVGWGTSDIRIMTTNSGIGYSVPAGSSWIGKTFNAIKFPKINGYGTITNRSFSGTVSVTAIISIGNPLTSTNLGYASTVVAASLPLSGPTTWNNEYILQFSDEITLNENYLITFFMTYIPGAINPVLMFRTFNKIFTSTLPLETISVINSQIESATEGVICDFITV